MQLVHKLLLILYYETVKLYYIDVFFKITIQEYCLDIHFL